MQGIEPIVTITGVLKISLQASYPFIFCIFFEKKGVNTYVKKKEFFCVQFNRKKKFISCQL